MLSFAFLCFPLASALVLTPATSDAIVQPAVSQNLTNLLESLKGPWQSANSTSSSLHSEPIWSCDGARFGYLLNVYSCSQALGMMLVGRDLTLQRTWFNRESEGTGVPLPQRYMSCKCPCLFQAGLSLLIWFQSAAGTCFVEPVITPWKGTTAQASLNDLKQGVKVRLF